MRNLTSKDEGSTNSPTLSLLLTIPPDTSETLLNVPSNSAFTCVFFNFLSALAKANSRLITVPLLWLRRDWAWSIAFLFEKTDCSAEAAESSAFSKDASDTTPLSIKPFFLASAWFLKSDCFIAALRSSFANSKAFVASIRSSFASFKSAFAKVTLSSESVASVITRTSSLVTLPPSTKFGDR